MIIFVMSCPLFDIHMEKKFFKTAKNQLFT